MIPKFAPSHEVEWEYRNFSYSMRQVENTWSALADYGYTPEPLARDYFWQLCEAEIVAELQRWQDDGWETNEPLSSHGLQLDSSEYIEDKIDLEDIMIWISTLGVALLINILFGRQPRRYLVYKAAEYSILMRRRVAQDVPNYDLCSQAARSSHASSMTASLP